MVVWWLHGNRTLLKILFLYGMKYNMAAMRNIFLTFAKKITNETLELVTLYLALTYVGLEDTYTVYYVRILIYRVNNRTEMFGNTNVYCELHNFNH